MSKENAIDKDHIAEIPHILPYTYNLGIALVRTEDQGKIKGKVLEAMYQQTDEQLGQIKEQIEQLARQANKIKEPIEISEKLN